MGLVTEQRPVPGPVVYGYLRLPASDQTRRAAFTRALRRYCDRHELALGGVYTDRSDGIWAPGFSSLLDALGTTGGYGVVIPSTAHLDTRQPAARRSAEITGNGPRLILIRGARPSKATSAEDR